MDEVQLQLNRFLYDQKYLTARTAHRLSFHFGIQEMVLAKVFVGLSVLLLTFWQHAALLANSVLLGYPLLMAVFFEKEAPLQEQMLLYWPFLAFFVVSDGLLDSLPFYHVVKVAVLVGIFVYPSGVTGLLQLTRENLRSHLREWALKPEELSILKRRKKHDDRRSQLITEVSPGASPNRPSDSWQSELNTADRIMYYNQEMILGSPGVESVFIRTPTRTFLEEEASLSTTYTSQKSTFI